MIVVSTMNGFSWGGSEELWYETVKYAIAQGYLVEVIVFKNEPISHKLIELSEQIPIHFIEPATPILPSLFKRILLKILRRPVPVFYADRFNFIHGLNGDIILLSQGGASDLVYYPDLKQYLQQNSKPLVIVNQLFSDDTYLNDAERQSLGEVYKKAIRVFFVSHQNREILERKLVMRFTDSELVKNPVNLSSTLILPWPVTEIINIAVVARLDITHKGLDLLLKVLSCTEWQRRDFILNIYGNGPHENYIRELIQFYKLEEKVLLKGHAGDVRKVWSENQLLVLPSRKEGMPLAVIEAMLCGRPVVVTNVGDSSLIVRNDETGWVAEAATIDHLQKALEQAWHHQNKWKEIGEQAHLVASAFIDKEPGKSFFEKIETLALAATSNF